MSSDAKWIVGTGVAIIVSVMGTGVALGTLVLMQINGVNTRIHGVNMRIDDLRTDVAGQIAELRTDVRGVDARLRSVETNFARIDQRLLTIERVLLPSSTADD